MSFGGQGSGAGAGSSGMGGNSHARLGGSVGASGIGAAMSRMDMLSRIEELQAQRRSRMNTPLFNTTNNTGSEQQQQQQMDAQERTTTPDSEDYEDEVVQPTPTNPPSLDVALTGSPDAWSMAGGDAHAGLEVYTVGHLMPRDGSFVDSTGNWSFDGNAFAGEMVGKQETASYPSTSSGSTGGSPPREKQTLRVRRSTFVPGWAVPPRVLLVDDDAVSRKLSSKFLQVFGCTIDVAVDGVGAVNKMNLEKYDLVLMVCPSTVCFYALS
jgi:osomolarity two-component system response regulator SKN7